MIILSFWLMQRIQLVFPKSAFCDKGTSILFPIVQAQTPIPLGKNVIRSHEFAVLFFFSLQASSSGRGSANEGTIVSFERGREEGASSLSWLAQEERVQSLVRHRLLYTVTRSLLVGIKWATKTVVNCDKVWMYSACLSCVKMRTPHCGRRVSGDYPCRTLSCDVPW